MDDINFADMSDAAIQNLLAEIGMDKRHSSSLLSQFRKRVSPEPKGYVSTSKLTRLFAINSIMLKEQLQSSAADSARLAVISNLCNLRTIPWYWLTKELGEDLTKTDVPSSIPSQLILPEYGIIVLPKGLITTTTGGIDCFAYKMFKPNEVCTVENAMTGDSGSKTPNTPAKIEIGFDGETGYRLCFCCLQNSYVYGGIIGLIPEGNEFRILQDTREFVEDAEVEAKETDELKKLLLNIITYASQQDKTYIDSVRGFGGESSTKKQSISRPIFIGENYKSIVSRSTTPSDGSGTQKAIHWRKGHWRKQAYGKSKQQRRWVLIAPTLVGIGKD